MSLPGMSDSAISVGAVRPTWTNQSQAHPGSWPEKALDAEWVKDQLRVFVELTLPRNMSGGGFITTQSRATAPRDVVVAQAVVVEKILDRVLPSWRSTVPASTHFEWHRHREAAQKALAELIRSDEIAEKLGESGPSLQAAGLHPVVWKAASALWASGHYAEAVSTSARSVNAQLQRRLSRRDVSEADAVAQAFSRSAPEEGKPRLRLIDDDGGATYRSVQDGAVAFGQGCFKAIRNVLAHEHGELSEPSEQEALEYLATFSVLARWIEKAELAEAAWTRGSRASST